MKELSSRIHIATDIGSFDVIFESKNKIVLETSGSFVYGIDTPESMSSFLTDNYDLDQVESESLQNLLKLVSNEMNKLFDQVSSIREEN